MLRLDLNWAYEYQIYDPYEQKVGYHHSYSAFWVRSGKITVRKGNKTFEAGADEWLFLPTGRYSLRIQLHTKYVYIGFFMSWTGHGTLVSPLQSLVWKTGRHPILEEKALRLCQSVSEKENAKFHLYEKEIAMKSHFEFRHLFYDWVRIWIGITAERNMGWQFIHEMDERLIPVANHLKTMPFDSPIDINRLAHETGLSRPQFFRLFHKQYGMPPKAYRDQFKVHQAVEEIQSSKKEIKEIASMFGYNNTQFGIWIKKHTSKTPSQIRRDRQP